MLNAFRALQAADTQQNAKIATLTALSEEARGANGSRYFVDNNSGSDRVDAGLSWEDPFKTLAFALAISHADIARGSDRWARRNSIYIAGDDFVEDLVAFARKTDIVGMGSSDSYPMACIRGNHVPVSASSGANYDGCRFFNVRFRPTASTDLVTLDSTSGTGIEFHGCIFDAHYGAFTAPSAIDTTASGYVKVAGCDFVGAYSGDVIDIGAGNISGMRIIGNTMIGGANDGIVVTGTTTIVQGRFALIAGNIIRVVGVTIDDGSDDTIVVADNIIISDGTTGANAWVIDTRQSAGNWYTDASKTGNLPVTA